MFDMIDWDAYRKEEAERKERERQNKWYRKVLRFLRRLV
jgi:hypothetical protein